MNTSSVTNMSYMFSDACL
ncbi:MAG: hypothetical protein IPH78_12220 [Bacteroidetes bacterium]|nr:hypothetical protein [Bacteroidota bacterium]